MSIVAFAESSPVADPLDEAENALSQRDWGFDRASDTELTIEAPGQWCHHRMAMTWTPEVHTLHLSSQYDMKVPPSRRAAVQDLLATINARLWLGHFDLDPVSMMPGFRYGLLTRGTTGPTADQMGDMFDMAVAECDRFYPAFQLVIWGGQSATEAVKAALMETAGEA